MDPEFTDWCFEIESLPREMHDGSDEYYPWWAVLTVSGTCAVGRGWTPWEAIRACIEDIGPTLENAEKMGRMFEKLQAGELSCPSCGTPLRPLSEEHPMGSFFCDAYPACGDKGRDLAG